MHPIFPPWISKGDQSSVYRRGILWAASNRKANQRDLKNLFPRGTGRTQGEVRMPVCGGTRMLDPQCPHFSHLPQSSSVIWSTQVPPQASSSPGRSPFLSQGTAGGRGSRLPLSGRRMSGRQPLRVSPRHLAHQVWATAPPVTTVLKEGTRKKEEEPRPLLLWTESGAVGEEGDGDGTGTGTACRP